MSEDLTAPLNGGFGSSTLYGAVDRSEDASMWTGLLWLSLSAVAVGLGNSLEPMSIFAWIHVYMLIIGFEYFAAEMSRRKPTCLGYDCSLLFTVFTATFILALGMTLGFSGSLGYPETTAATVALTFVMGILWWFAIICLAVLPSHFVLQRYPRWVLTPFVFTICYVTVSICVLGEILSTFSCLSNAVLDYAPLRQLASLFGLAGIEAIVVLCSSALAILHLDRGTASHAKTASWIVGVVLFLLAVGSYLHVEDTFYQRDITTTASPTVPMSCILGQEATPGSEAWNATMSSTRQRVAAGDRLILWSEIAMRVSSREEERSLLADGAELAAGTAYIGLTYVHQEHPGGPAANRFALITPQGAIAWNYRKAYPVPFVEPEVVPGPPVLPFRSADGLGLLTGAICFDFDHPGLIRQAGAGRADLLLQPSWTWGAVGRRHFAGNAVRAVENGVAIFRCSSDGVSGVVSSTGHVLAQAVTGHDPSQPFTFNVPVRPDPPAAAGAGGGRPGASRSGGRTVWVWGGFAAQWVCAAAAAALCALPLLPAAWADAVVARLGPPAAAQ